MPMRRYLLLHTSFVDVATFTEPDYPLCCSYYIELEDVLEVSAASLDGTIPYCAVQGTQYSKSAGERRAMVCWKFRQRVCAAVSR
jgi:hypothetical protein